MSEQKTDLSKKSCIVVDNGLFVEQAKKLAKDFKSVKYYMPWKNSFPKRNAMQVGMGVEGIERISDLFDHLDDTDIVVFPDVYDGDLQKFLINRGMTVFGGRKGEEMELYRKEMKEQMKKLGLPVNRYWNVKGTKELRALLKEQKDVWVKISLYRGEFETFHSKSLELVEPLIDQIEHNMGPMAKIQEFIVEKNLCDKVEIGYDGYTVDGQYPTKGIIGTEVKDLGYLAKFVDYKSIPKEITDFNETIKPLMQGYKYRGFFSTEIRVGKDKVPYMIDMCARAGSPPNELYQEMYTNFSEIIWETANGNCIDPIAKEKFGVEVLIHCPFADSNWSAIKFPKEYRDNIKFRNLTIIEGKYYIVPQALGLPEIGAVVATGNTLKEAIDKVKVIAETIEGYDLDIPMQAIDKGLAEVKKSEEYGIKLF